MSEVRQNRRSLLIGAGIVVLVLFLLFGLVFPGRVILPASFPIGPVSIRFYGIFLGLAMLAGYRLALSRLAAYKLDRDQVDNLLLAAVVGGFIGARLYHVFSEWSYYWAHPQLIPAIWHGGLSIFGAVLGGLLTTVIYIRYFDRSMNLSRILDWLVPSLALGQAIGRFGNLFNYEAYGYPTQLPWKMFVPPPFRLAPYELSVYFHPLFLYEALGSLLIAWSLLKFNPKAPPGQLFALWLFLYNGMRFFLEMLRIDSVLVGGVKLNMIISFLLAIIGLSIFIKLQHAHSNSYHS